MKFVVIFTTLIVVINSYSIPNFDSPELRNKVETIKKEYEENFKTLPKAIQEDAKLLVPQLIEKYGYPSEVHTVHSKDGYVLQIHRIPYGKKGPSENRPAVYLQHGLLCSSADWVTPGPEKGFAYLLADAGYDVWLANARGNRYSRNHTSLDPSTNAKQFWDFSWHEIGVDDVPTMVDYVREQTKQDKIFYIGHSQGTTASYVMLSEKPENNDKFRAVFSLAPVAYMGHMTSPLLRIISEFANFLEFLANVIGVHEFLPRTEFVAQVGETLCGDESALQILCTNALFALVGFNRKQMNTTLIPIIMGHMPAGSSTKQLLHFAQGFKSGKFRQWDYGLLGNLINYKSSSPPRYKLENVKAPIYMYYSPNDWLSNVKDVNELASQLPNLKGKFKTKDNKFNHADYLFAIDAPKILYHEVIDLMKIH